LGVLVAAAACLMLAFVGYQLSGTGHPATSSAAGGGTSSLNSMGSTPFHGPGARRHTVSPSIGSASTASFVLLVRGTHFRKATLQAQVIQQMERSPDHPTVGPDASASADPLSPVGRTRPQPNLIGCVKYLLGGAMPALVEEASYQSRPAYIIAVP